MATMTDVAEAVGAVVQQVDYAGAGIDSEEVEAQIAAEVQELKRQYAVESKVVALIRDFPRNTQLLQSNYDALQKHVNALPAKIRNAENRLALLDKRADRTFRQMDNDPIFARMMEARWARRLAAAPTDPTE